MRRKSLETLNNDYGRYIWRKWLVLLVLLVPYVYHYYCLENEVQKLYAQYERLLEKCGSGESAG